MMIGDCLGLAQFARTTRKLISFTLFITIVSRCLCDSVFGQISSEDVVDRVREAITSYDKVLNGKKVVIESQNERREGCS
jgi:hypothetical protein